MFFSQGRYCEAVDEWERAKEEGVADSALYTSVMKMAAQVGGVEAVQSVKEDMESQGWSMDHRYTHTSDLSHISNTGKVRRVFLSKPATALVVPQQICQVLGATCSQSKTYMWVGILGSAQFPRFLQLDYGHTLTNIAVYCICYSFSVVVLGSP